MAAVSLRDLGRATACVRRPPEALWRCFSHAKRQRETTSAPPNSTPPAAEVFERVVNRQRVIVNETVRTLCDAVSSTKKSFYIMDGRTATSQRSNSARIKIVS